MNTDYINGETFFKAQSGSAKEGFQYFYHADHLGSSSYITGVNGEEVEHIEYLSYGELLLDERSTNWYTRYRFTGKEQDEETGLIYISQRYLDPKTSVWLSVDELRGKYFWTSSYVYCLNNPIKFSDPTGMGPKDRVRYAKNMTGIAYSQETNSILRTANTEEALKFMDCAEFVCRIMAKDEITKGVVHMGSSALKAFLNDKSKFIHSDNPQLGDIALWEGHVGIVTGVDNEGKIKITHARGKGKLSQENPYFITPKQYRDSKFYGYYRLISEKPDNNNPVITPITVSYNNIIKNNGSNETTYYAGELKGIVVTAPALNKTERKIPLLKIE